MKLNPEDCKAPCEHNRDRQVCVAKGMLQGKRGMRFIHVHWCSLCGALMEQVLPFGPYHILTAPLTLEQFEEITAEPSLDDVDVEIGTFSLGDVLRALDKEIDELERRRRNARSN